MTKNLKLRFSMVDTFVQTLEANMPIDNVALKLITKTQCDSIKQEIEIYCVLYPDIKDAFVGKQINVMEDLFEKCFVLGKVAGGVRRKQLQYLAMYIYDVILFLYEMQD